MKVTIADYNGYNPNCPTVKKSLKWLEEKGEVSLEDLYRDISTLVIFRFGEIRKFLIPSRLEEFDQWARIEAGIEISELDNKIYQLESDLKHIEFTSTLNPVRMYHYFRKNQTKLTDREHDKVVHDILYSILRGAVFELEDYGLLRKELKNWYNYHVDVESHYRWAVMANNRSAIKSIEKYLNRKPFLIGTKRCYEDFKFCTGNNEHYKCTGFDENKIKFVLYENRMGQGPRKLFKFDNKEFKEHFKDKKII
jgi:hypothetical protein